MDYFDLDALATLLGYNKEDVLNIKILREKLLTNFQERAKQLSVLFHLE